MPEISATEGGREKGGRSQGKHFNLKSKFTWINVAAHHIHRYLLLLLCGLKLSGWLTPPPESSTALSENNPPASNHTRVWRYVQPGHWSALSPLTAAKGTENKAAGGSGWRGAPPAENLDFCRTARGSEGEKNQKRSEAVGGEHHVTRWLSLSLVISERGEIFKAWRVKRRNSDTEETTEKHCVWTPSPEIPQNVFHILPPALISAS